jgi:hypothetical protein
MLMFFEAMISSVQQCVLRITRAGRHMWIPVHAFSRMEEDVTAVLPEERMGWVGLFIFLRRKTGALQRLPPYHFLSTPGPVPGKPEINIFDPP